MYSVSFLSLSLLCESFAVNVLPSVLSVFGRLVLYQRSHSCNAADNAIKTDCEITIHLATLSEPVLVFVELFQLRAIFLVQLPSL